MATAHSAVDLKTFTCRCDKPVKVVISSQSRQSFVLVSAATLALSRLAAAAYGERVVTPADLAGSCVDAYVKGASCEGLLPRS